LLRAGLNARKIAKYWKLSIGGYFCICERFQ